MARQSIAVLCFVILLSEAGELAADFEMALEPTRQSFALNEPVTIRMAVRNASDHELRLGIGYPRFLGLSFTCQDSDAVPRVGTHATNVRIPFVDILPGAEYAPTFVLNRYFSFRAPKGYSIQWLCDLREATSAKRPNPESYSFKGAFKIEITEPRDNVIDLDRVTSKAAKGKGLEAKEAVEYLIWVDDPRVIDTLLDAAKRIEGVGLEIVDGLRKYAGSENGLQALRKAATIVMEVQAFQSMIAVHEELGIGLPEGFVKEMLSSRHSGRRYCTLEFLLKRGDFGFLPLVLPLRKDENPIIAKLAEEFIRRSERERSGQP